MRRDKNAPRLYELLGESPPSQDRLRAPLVPRPVRVDLPADDTAPKSRVSGNGRTIQLPAGYAFFAIAFLLLALILGYFIGYAKRGREYTREQARLAAEQTPDNTLPIRDPLADPTGTEPRVNPPRQTPSNSNSGASNPPLQPRAIIIERGDPDPREPGLNYFIAARLPPENAIQAAEYLTSRGVPAARLAPDRDNWCKVIALRGFDASSIRGPEAEKLADQIRAIGRDFKRNERGGDDFASTYPEKYTGN
ncbi:MAG: hypothetical protein KDA16_05350 [Phycisphaerales bacterium]|nr:hypothetical protein [Phycisphaerales bacterium]